MTGGQMMVVLIVAIVMFASIIKSKHGHTNRRIRERMGADAAAIESGEAQRLREEVTRLKERVAVLERIATDRETSLARQIEELRER